MESRELGKNTAFQMQKPYPQNTVFFFPSLTLHSNNFFLWQHSCHYDPWFIWSHGTGKIFVIFCYVTNYTKIKSLKCILHLLSHSFHGSESGLSLASGEGSFMRTQSSSQLGLQSHPGV